MGNEQIRVLLIEDQLVHARLMEEIFRLVGSDDFRLLHSETLARGIHRLQNEHVDIVLLDLNLPDSRGYDTFKQIQELFLNIPVILMTATNDEKIALRAIQDGAQDYLVKGEVVAKLLFRAMRYASERHQMQSELRSLSLTDELTGLYNRRGFTTLASQHLKLARRNEQIFFIVFADLDSLKKVNDAFGHAEGDTVLMATANVLRRTFGESDILARYGGDEFLVLATDAVTDSQDQIYARLKKNIEDINNGNLLRCQLSLSLGIIHCEPAQEETIEQLIAAADKALYKDKQLRVIS
jgi:diguanylate cyclase (GGDEF)-like protein